MTAASRLDFMVAMGSLAHIRENRPGVWITRAEPGASATAERLTRLGFKPVIAPLLTFRPLEADLCLEPNEAFAFTSINAVTRTAALLADRQAQVFAVGDATAQAARAAGFVKVASADGNVEALSMLINQSDWRGAVLHPCALQTAGDLVGALKSQGIAARKLAVYETLEATALPKNVGDMLNGGRLFAALFHSPKAARTAAALERPAAAFAPVVAIGLSQACIDPLNAAGFKALLAAPRPNEDALMDRLGAAFSPQGADGRG